MTRRWTPLTNLAALQSRSAAFSPDVMLLLTDGSVLVHQRKERASHSAHRHGMGRRIRPESR
jgi:hypothetical protein